MASLLNNKHSRAWLLPQDGAAIHQTAASIEAATSIWLGWSVVEGCWPHCLHSALTRVSLGSKVWALMSRKLSRMIVGTAAT